MDDASTESWIASLRAGRANLTPSPASGSEPKMSAGSGPTSPESSMSAELPSSSARTSPASYGTPAAKLRTTIDLTSGRTVQTWTTTQTDLWGEWEPFSGIWPRWGLCLSGEAFQLPTWAPRTDALESLSLASSRVAGDGWSTPSGQVFQDGADVENELRRRAALNEKCHNGSAIPLTIQAQMWQTPAVDSFRSRGGDRKDEMGLDQQARFWPSPRVKGDSDGARAASATRHKGDDLHTSAGKWPTPTAMDCEQAGGICESRGLSLFTAAGNWPSPSARDHRDPNAHPYQDRDGGSKGEQLPNFVEHHWILPPARRIPAGPQFWLRVRILLRLCRLLRQRLPSPYRKAGSIFKRKLNPNFVDWLMGWLDGWSDADRVFSAEEMESYRFRQQFAMSLLLGDSPGSSGRADEAVFDRALPGAADGGPGGVLEVVSQGQEGRYQDAETNERRLR
ncbi:MAG: Site-specific methylase [Thermomicrobiales bacterium]|nr:Site-specific methylase [Thermomicrobiales bacterium]